MRKRIWAVLLVLTLAAGCIPAVGVADTTRVTRCNLRLRAGTTTESDTLVTIPGGTEITVLGTSGGWTKTTYNGHTGYISSAYLMDLTKSGYYPLKEGDESIYVRSLQDALVKLGYMSTAATGKYESDTTQAVKAFQQQNGISADGVAGGETQRTLYGDTAKGNSGSVTTTDNSGNTTTPQANATVAPSTSGKVSSTVLRLKSRGDDVKNLQARLIELGYLGGSADGVFGALTHKAVTEFQRKSGLTVDGKAGSVTQTLLYSSSAVNATGSVNNNNNATDNSTGSNTSSTTYKTLKRGMTSNDVKSLQQKLKDLGYMSANATGYFGSATLAAVKSFQGSNGLAVDGVAGNATQQKLFGNDASKAGSGTPTEDEKTYATLKQGMKSSAVTTMQKKLKELGYLSANATGYFGTATLAALKSFQSKNGLTSDGVAGSATLAVLYGSSAVGSSGSSGGSSSGSGAGKISGPSSSAVKLLHWFNTVKPSLKNGNTLLVYDPSTSYGWNLRAMSLGRHLDAEPATSADTESMNNAFGNSTTWTPKIVYIKLPSGTWTMATTHNTPHLSGSTKDNNFDGHLCVHFLRDMDEVSKNDPNYGVQNQKALREAWKKLTGQTVQ